MVIKHRKRKEYTVCNDQDAELVTVETMDLAVLVARDSAGDHLTEAEILLVNNLTGKSC